MIFRKWIKGENPDRRTKSKRKSSLDTRIVEVEDGTRVYNCPRLRDEFSPHPYETKPVPWLESEIDIIRTKNGIIRPIFDSDKNITAYRFTFSDKCVKDTGILARYYFGETIVNANELERRDKRFDFQKFDKEDDFLEGAYSIEYDLNNPVIDVLNSNDGLAPLRNLETHASGLKERLDEKGWEKTKFYFPRFMEMVALSILVRNTTEDIVFNENYKSLGLKQTHYGGVPKIGTDIYHPGIIDLKTGVGEREPKLLDNSAFFGIVTKRWNKKEAKDFKHII
tara:strand:- start:1514 stop:2356 length:843 start_codon:yes stop_codon:yes gene_type:complete